MTTEKNKKSILYLAHRIPYPPNKGDKIRAFHEVKYLSQSYDVDLLSLADDPDDLQYQKELQKWCRRMVVFPLNKKAATLKGALGLAAGKSISEAYFYKRALQGLFDQWITLNQYRMIICFSSPMAAYVFNSRALLGLTRCPELIMDFCDLDSDKWLQYSKNARFPMNFVYAAEGKRLLAYEKKINCHFDRSVFVSNREKELFQAYYPAAVKLQVIPNGVDYDYFSPADTTSESFDPNVISLPDASRHHHPVLMFSGAMDYHANVDGVQWFCREVLPAIKKVHPEVLFYIVGSHPTKEVKALAQRKEVVVTGFVEDIRDFYRAADICVIPLRMARGVQNKVLEAMAVGKAVVTTEIAIQGIRAVPGKELISVDDSEQFAQAVIELLENKVKMLSLGQNARKYVTENHCWENNLHCFFTMTSR